MATSDSTPPERLYYYSDRLVKALKAFNFGYAAGDISAKQQQGENIRIDPSNGSTKSVQENMGLFFTLNMGTPVTIAYLFNIARYVNSEDYVTMDSFLENSPIVKEMWMSTDITLNGTTRTVTERPVEKGMLVHYVISQNLINDSDLTEDEREKLFNPAYVAISEANKTYIKGKKAQAIKGLFDYQKQVYDLLPAVIEGRKKYKEDAMKLKAAATAERKSSITATENSLLLLKAADILRDSSTPLAMNTQLTLSSDDLNTLDAAVSTVKKYIVSRATKAIENSPVAKKDSEVTSSVQPLTRATPQAVAWVPSMPTSPARSTDSIVAPSSPGKTSPSVLAPSIIPSSRPASPAMRPMTPGRLASPSPVRMSSSLAQASPTRIEPLSPQFDSLSSIREVDSGATTAAFPTPAKMTSSPQSPLIAGGMLQSPTVSSPLALSNMFATPVQSSFQSPMLPANMFATPVQSSFQSPPSPRMTAVSQSPMLPANMFATPVQSSAVSQSPMGLASMFASPASSSFQSPPSPRMSAVSQSPMGLSNMFPSPASSSAVSQSPMGLSSMLPSSGQYSSSR